jgi:inosine-uridine nucleoside N-ribohydrolase
MRIPRTLSLAACAFAAASLGWSKTPVILSTDVGNEIDDQWAIAYMLVNPDFEVLGIVSAHAPSLPDPSAHYTYEVLKDEVERRLGMMVHPPLFEGSSKPLANATTPSPNAGVDFIVNASKSYSASNPLTVLTIGAATDVASAILYDPAIAERIRVVAMAFPSEKGGDEYNVANDVAAWQVLLASRVPLVIGAGDICRAYLALNFAHAKDLISTHGPIGAWLWQEYQLWYFRDVKPLRRPDFSKPWIIWDIITLAYLEGMATSETKPRPRLQDDMSFAAGESPNTVTWITTVDSQRLWTDFLLKLDTYQRTHAIPPSI